MTGPATPGQEGPSYDPPLLPEGWIAQWDGVSKTYYFVQLSTGHRQWETPTHAAPTGGTTTPGHETSPYAQPGQEQPIGERGMEGGQDGPVGERGFGQMAMNQLFHSNRQSSPLVGLAGQLLGGGRQHSSGQSSNAGPAGLVGALAGSLLGGGNTKPNQQGPQQSYSGQPPQGAYGQQGGFMGKLGGMLGGSSHGQQGNYGYHDSGQHQGGYTGQEPPSSYQPGAGSASYNPQQPFHAQSPPVDSTQGTGSYYGQQQQQPAYGASPQPSYGAPLQQQPPYGGPQQQPPYGAVQQPAYGAPPQQQPAYGVPPQHQQQQPYGSPAPTYGQPSGNLDQPHHHMFQGGLYGDGDSHGGAPPLPTGSRPNQGQQGGYGAPGQGQGVYSEMPGSSRW